MKKLNVGVTIGVALAIFSPFASAGAQEQKKPMETVKPKNLASDIKAEALWDGRGMVPFKGLDNPPMVLADKADYLGDEEYVLALTVNGTPRAYPTRFVWWHHVVNDRAGNTEFAVSYCSVCNTGIAYNRKLNGKTVALDFYGLYNGVVTLVDRKTESVFLQAGGRFVSSDLSGKELDTLPMLDTTWGEWKKLHPDTLVMSPDTAFSKMYTPKGTAESRDYKAFPAPFFRPTLTRYDKRLPAFDKVVALVLKGDDGKPIYRAYPVKTLAESNSVVNDTLGKTAVAVFFNPDVVSAAAMNRELEGKVYTFETKKDTDGKLGYYDHETGSQWTLEGLSIAGTLKGKSLTRLSSHQSQWYGWVATFPDTSIYGKTDPPMSLTEIPDEAFPKR